MRIATWNVNSLPMRLPRVLEWLDLAHPDVLCMQETKVADATFPHEVFAARGYRAAAHGLGQWNGVAILSRVGIEDVVCGFENEPGFPDPESRIVAATCSGVRVWSLYAPNGRSVDSPHYAYKLAWLEALRASLQSVPPVQPAAICGDFNIAPTDADVWDPAQFIGSTHVTPAERGALQKLLDAGFVDVKPRIAKGEPFTYWDYRAGNFHKGFGMRIDLVLLSTDLASQLTDAHIDRDTRKGKAPSDHAAVVVDVGL